MHRIGRPRAAAEADQALAERQLRTEEAFGPTALGDDRDEHALVGLSLGDQDARDRNEMAHGLDQAFEHLVEPFTRQNVVVDLGELPVRRGNKLTTLGGRSFPNV